jgi:hypothetical protein
MSARAPARDERLRRDVREPAQREGEHALGRGVQPLHIVDGHDERAVERQSLQQPEGGARDRQPICRPVRVRAIERPVERGALGPRELDRVRDRAEQVAERRERQGGLGLRGPGGEHGQTARAGHPDALLPDRRLADPGLAGQHERARGRGLVGEQPTDLLQLSAPPQDALAHGATLGQPRRRSRDARIGRGAGLQLLAPAAVAPRAAPLA